MSSASAGSSGRTQTGRRGYDCATTAGVLSASRPVSRQEVSLMDIAPTVMKSFGVPILGELDGQPLV